MSLLKDLVVVTEDLTPVEGTLEEQMDELTRRMAAAKRGLGFANQLRDPAQKKRHLRVIMGNLNRIRGQLGRVVKQLEDFHRAEDEYHQDIM